MGDGGAERLDPEPVSTAEAVAIVGRFDEGGGMRNERFFRLRDRWLGESGRALLGVGSSLELSGGIMGREATSMARAGGGNL